MNKLPNGWQIKTLGDIFLIERGSSPRPIKSFLTNDNNGINWIKIGDAKNNSKYIYQSAEKIRPEGKKYSRFVEIGDLILSNSMSFGRPYIMKTIGCIHDGWVVLRKILKNIIYEEYAYYILSSNQVHSEFSKLAAGSVVKNLSIDRIKQVYIPIPPLDEQKRIASALSKIDAYLENTIKLIEEKERFKRGIAKKLLTCKEGENIPEARFKGFEDEWEIVKLGDMFDNFKEKNNEDKIILSSTIDKGVIPNSLTERKIIRKKESLSNYKLVKKGCFVISLMSFQSGFEYSDYEGIIRPAYTVLKPKIEMAHYFYKYYFKSFKFIKDLLPYAEGIRHGKQIKFKACKDILVPYPSIEEQEKIGGYLSLLDAEIDNLKKQKELIKEMKRGAMEKLLSGEVRLVDNYD
ncbi:restriction endonuclease subunit S [uncultured Brachyspira sp.]|uniref:restriction endonuclease subunit S n=1 Tax=uncultured Brachyspira sp. TaxID=221953 RepID=UPI0027DBEFDD|nr:restriction endonuclease subunit S [uncultured Brachyspira sp.]